MRSGSPAPIGAAGRMQWRRAALQIRDATAKKDLATLASAGDALAETCTACHARYRPEKPSDGIVRYPFYPKRQRVAG